MKEIVIYYNSVALFRFRLEQPTQEAVIQALNAAKEINVIWSEVRVKQIRLAAIEGVRRLDWAQVSDKSTPFEQNDFHFSIRVLEVKDIGK